MALEIPAAAARKLADLDASTGPIDDHQSFTIDAPPAGTELSLEQRRGGFAEVAPWQFVRSNMFERGNPWGTYWSEMASGTMADGRRLLIPDADNADAEIVAHWIKRAGELRHPVLRSRYADVAWEIGRYLAKRGKEIGNAELAGIRVPISMAHTAIDAYLDCVDRQLAEDFMAAWWYLNRAIELSKSISDATRLARSRATMFSLREAVRAVDRHTGQTWRFYDIAAHHFSGDLTAAEKAQIVTDLQAELRITSDISNPQTFNPHDATNIAERLERWGRMAGNSAIGPQAIKVAGAAFEQAAAKAGGLVAVAWLEDLLPRYRDIGDATAAARVEEAIRQRSVDARAEMTTRSVTVEFPREEFDQLAEQVCGESLNQALARVVGAMLMKYDSMVKQVRSTLEGAPLFSMISISLPGPEGFTEATVGGIEEDEEGRAVHYAGQMMSMQAGMLGRFFELIGQKYKPSAAQIADHIELCAFFSSDRRPLLERGMQAWLDRDSVVAVHLLVPQLEAALRALCRKAGGSVMTPASGGGGFRVNGMGAVLHEKNLAAVMPPDVRFHLAALFTDPRGLSVRNHIAHGMSLPEALGMGLCNWVVHAVLMVALFRPNTAAEPPPAAQEES